MRFQPAGFGWARALQSLPLMITALVLVSVLSADGEVVLTAPPVEPAPLGITAATVALTNDPDANGRGFLKHGFALATLGTTMTLGGAIGMALVISASMRCAASVRCFDEGGSAIGSMMAGIPLSIGVSMLAVAIPLFIKGFRERYPG